MGLGRLSTPLLFLHSTPRADAQGFRHPGGLSGFAWNGAFEERSATTRWANLAGFAQVDALVKIRRPYGFNPKVGNELFIQGRYFTITGIENVKNRGRYFVLFLREVKHRG